jgi:glycosyltransferase involved in cell wall biosynthesis
MLGRNAGMVTTQGEKLTDLFAAAGYPVISASSIPNRILRLCDIARVILQRRHGIDVCVLQVFGGRSFVVEDVASSLARRIRKPLIMVLRGGAMPEFMARYPGWSHRVLSRADQIVAPSAFLARAILPYGFQARIIPNVIDLSRYPYRRRRAISPRLLWMRTFHPVYNPQMALRVLARLRQEGLEATLVMAGQEKGLGPAVAALARELGVSPAVRFPGFLEMEGKAREGDAADLFLNTNSVDNMPVSVVEACAMGLPVVATAVGGVPDLLTDGETGLLVPDDDDERMAEACMRLLRDPDLTERLSTGGRQLAEACSWPQVRRQWEEIFAAV